MTVCDKPSRGRYAQGCRCDGCREENRIYHHKRTRKNLMIELGEDVSNFVDAEPVRRKVRHLISQGYTKREICRLSGVSRTTMHHIMISHPRTGKPVTKCKRETKDAICSIKGNRHLKSGTLIDSEVISGHVREWAEWLTPLEIAEAIGVDRETVYRIRRGQSRLSAKTAYKFTVNIKRAQELVKEKKRERGWVV